MTSNDWKKMQLVKWNNGYNATPICSSRCWGEWEHDCYGAWEHTSMLFCLSVALLVYRTVPEAFYDFCLNVMSWIRLCFGKRVEDFSKIVFSHANNSFSSLFPQPIWWRPILCLLLCNMKCIRHCADIFSLSSLSLLCLIIQCLCS